jgi:hypothetical protein
VTIVKGRRREGEELLKSTREDKGTDKEKLATESEKERLS